MVLITVILFIIYPIFTLPLIIFGIIKDKKNRLIHLILLAFDLALIALHFDPSSYNLDLNGYFSIMDIMKTMGWDAFIQNFLTQKEFLTNLLFYIFANINNYELWTFFVTFISYSLIFYMINDYSKIKGMNDRNYFLILCLLILLYNNFFVMAGIRNSLAMILFLFVLYLEYIKEKKNIFYKILYILPCLVHMSMVLGVILRIILFFYKGKKKIYIVIGLMFYAFMPSVILAVANEFTGIGIFSDLYEKTANYITNPKEAVLENVLYIMKIMTFVNLFIIFEKIYKKEDSKIRNATELVCLFTFFSFNYTVIMYRWFDACALLLCFSFINKIELYRQIKGIYKIILAMTLVFCIIQQTNSFAKVNYVEAIKETYNKTLIENFRNND